MCSLWLRKQPGGGLRGNVVNLDGEVTGVGIDMDIGGLDDAATAAAATEAESREVDQSKPKYGLIPRL